MKNLIHSGIKNSILALFLGGFAIGHDDNLAGDHRDVYLTQFSGMRLSTTDANIQIHTKQDPFTAADGDLIMAHILIPQSWGKGLVLDFQIYIYEEGQRVLLGGFPLSNQGNLSKDKELKSDFYTFVIQKKYFDQSLITFDTDKESIYIHLQRQKEPNKAEMATPRKPSD